jgi:SAM-dependent methyltransferase
MGAVDTSRCLRPKKILGMTATKRLLNSFHHNFILGRRVRVLSEVLAKMFPQDAKVLDVGTGDGSIARQIMEQRRDVTIQGVDVVLRAHTHIPVELFDGRRLPFSNESFDCVMFVDVLHHTEDPRTSIAEASRVSKYHVIIKDHLLEGLLASRQILGFMDWVGNCDHGVALPCNYVSRREWEQIFDEACLSIELWIERLGLYPAPAALLFERGLQFVTRLVKR